MHEVFSSHFIFTEKGDEGIIRCCTLMSLDRKYILFQGQIKHLQVIEFSEEDCNFLPYDFVFSFKHGHVTIIIHLKIVANKYFLNIKMKIKKA